MGSRGKLKKKLKGLEDLAKSKKEIEDLRFFLLFQMAKIDHMWQRLVEMKIVACFESNRDVFEEMRSEYKLTVLGYDPKSVDIKQKIIDFESSLRKGSR